jgi:hypothetical protein
MIASTLLRNLIVGAGSNSQFIGGLVIVLLYVVIGFLGAVGSILVCRRIFQGRWEQIFWASFLVVIAAFYLSFAAFFEASTLAWKTEIVVVVVFLVCALAGLFFRSAIAVGYVLHGLWDLAHCLSGSSLAGLSITETPLGYGIFCSTFDFTVACYLMISDTAWRESGKVDLLFLATSLVIPLAAGVGYSRLAVRVIWIHVVTHSRGGVVARSDEIG